MITCYHCGKGIRGNVVHHNPPLYLEQMGLDSPKSYHTRCYEVAEKQACRELRRRNDCFECPDWQACEITLPTEGRDEG
jgi:hypothetical protein